jgi:hypothetical protein
VSKDISNGQRETLKHEEDLVQWWPIHPLGYAVRTRGIEHEMTGPCEKLTERDFRPKPGVQRLWGSGGIAENHYGHVLSESR